MSIIDLSGLVALSRLHWEEVVVVGAKPTTGVDFDSTVIPNDKTAGPGNRMSQGCADGAGRSLQEPHAAPPRKNFREAAARESNCKCRMPLHSGDHARLVSATRRLIEAWDEKEVSGIRDLVFWVEVVRGEVFP